MGISPGQNTYRNPKNFTSEAYCPKLPLDAIKISAVTGLRKIGALRSG